jgi:hypothetical protein
VYELVALTAARICVPAASFVPWSRLPEHELAAGDVVQVRRGTTVLPSGFVVSSVK